jgi:hypothetical protein
MAILWPRPNQTSKARTTVATAQNMSMVVIVV